MREEEALQRLLHQAAVKVGKTGIPSVSRFIPAAAFPLAVHEAREQGVEAIRDGGWPDAERVQVCFCPMGEEPVFTLRWLRITWNTRFSAPEHRDLLGSLMGLGIDRSWFGDLLLQKQDALLCCLPPMDERLPQEWTQAGRHPITVTPCEAPPVIAAQAGEDMHTTVASLRLDAVLAAGLNLSRAKAAELIRAGDVAVNHLPEEATDRLLTAGDLLSIRHVGRLRLDGVAEPNRKERIPLNLTRYLR